MLHSNLSKLVILLFGLLISFNPLQAQAVQKEQNPYVQILKEQDFTFTAQAYATASSEKKQMTDPYSFKVSLDSIVGVLPYYGQSYTAQINLTDGSIKFNILKYKYELIEKKKNRYQVSIKPEDKNTTIQSFYMTIFSDGTGQVDVVSRNREPMTFYGSISR
ncbi:MAG: hypothetical protein B7X72_13360 [Sphingobacteriia bacterium 39-39-8]|nr:MAG: hypothetical protein B7Y76_06560 [Sphingobacteriia bacterium 35-40-5]OZA61844.1 MAG: hypothetical protein B7X72_13360 [Sphingobacteriia bacterium 39-39-8]HQR94252.1 DUF4251 domain-containing protein [Sediminibacterium sp.]